jgi:hypothetical protein
MMVTAGNHYQQSEKSGRRPPEDVTRYFHRTGKSCQLDEKPIFVDPQFYAQNGAGLVNSSFFNRLKNSL